MQFYVLKETADILDFNEIRLLFPRVSFTNAGPDDDFLAENNFARLVGDEVPEYQPGQTVTPTNKAKLIDGEWIRIVEVTGEPTPPPSAEAEIPNEAVVIDQGTGEPVKIIVKNGQVFVGGMDDETPA